VTFENDDNYLIQFEISNNSITIRFNSIKNEKTLFAHRALMLNEKYSKNVMRDKRSQQNILHATTVKLLTTTPAS